ncbi:MAG: Two component transcriptional regulator, winged helix family [Ilumatobacteraceae bacterium]|nr:Two component transcriptional regulator, winged helix family [Ilumatobacteraceae bacterium]
MQVMTASLAARHYEVRGVTNGAEALECVAVSEPDVIILDLGLPDVDGIDLCRHLRLRVKSPIIVVTADGNQSRMVQALDEGADDYVTKPFSMPELLARVRVALRHRALLSVVADDPVIQLGALTVDIGGHVAALDGRLLDLPPKQFRLLAVLVRNPGRMHTHRSLVHQMWGPENEEPASHALRVLVSKLRASLGDGVGVPRIITEPRVGYRLVLGDD